MTWKKRQEHVMDGDICEPSEWRINNNEFASEFNGFLDRDNIRADAVIDTQIKRDTFTRVIHDQEFYLYDYVLSHKKSGYTSVPDYKFRMGDGPLGTNYDAEWEGPANIGTAQVGLDSLDLITGPGTYLYSAPFKSEYGGDYVSNKYALGISNCESVADQDDPNRECRLPHYEFTTEGDALIIIDFSATVQYLHGFTLNNAADFQNWCVLKKHGQDINELMDGRSEIKVNSLGYPYLLDASHKTPYKTAKMLCSIWRILVDGTTVCKTGMLGPELEMQSIYLTGAIPVSSGKHTVELQGKACWYCPTSGSQIPSSANDKGLVNAVINWNVGPETGTEKIRKDIALRFPNLVVQVRSR